MLSCPLSCVLVALFASSAHAAAPVPYQWKTMTLVTSTGPDRTFKISNEKSPSI
jgi:hypothetical protein